MPLGLFRSQQNGAVTRMWRSCRVQPSYKERTICVARCKRGCCCNHSVGVALNVWFTTNSMCAKKNANTYAARTSNNRVIAAHDLYGCLLPQCEALRTCRSGFPIVTLYCACFQSSSKPYTLLLPRMCRRGMIEAKDPEIQGSGSPKEWNYIKCIYQNFATIPGVQNFLWMLVGCSNC